MQKRLLAALRDCGSFCAGNEPKSELVRDETDIRIRPEGLNSCLEVCEQADWQVTASLGFDGRTWEMLDLEPGDTTAQHYGLCADLGSTTIVMELINLNTGETLASESVFNPQIAYGDDILTRIFYTKDHPERRRELQEATAKGFRKLMERLSEKTGVDTRKCNILTVAGNTTMIHFLLGLDAFGVFQSPYAVQTLEPEVCRGAELRIPIQGFVYICPAMENYLGGDIISGMLATGLPDREEISVFLDVGTNGELVVGNREFLLAGAGAAGPALEGGSVRTGMRAENGAVDRVTTEHGQLKAHVIGGTEAKGICGSGIVDLLAELYLNGWIDLRGRFQVAETEIEESAGGGEKGQSRIPGLTKQLLRDAASEKDTEYAIEYAPGLYFYQSDIDEFIRTKAAAMTMVEYMMNLIGLTMEDVGCFYVAGAFGTHIDKESAVTIGMYPDMDRDKIISPGNTSLKGAKKLLLDRSLKEKAETIIERMQYVQFGAVEEFIELMRAAQAIPHTDLQRFPSVPARLEQRRKSDPKTDPKT